MQLCSTLDYLGKFYQIPLLITLVSTWHDLSDLSKKVAAAADAMILQ